MKQLNFVSSRRRVNKRAANRALFLCQCQVYHYSADVEVNNKEEQIFPFTGSNFELFGALRTVQPQHWICQEQHSSEAATDSLLVIFSNRFLVIDLKCKHSRQIRSTSGTRLDERSADWCFLERIGDEPADMARSLCDANSPVSCGHC